MWVERFLAWATAQLWFIGSSLCLPSSIKLLLFGYHVLGILLISWWSVFAICCRLQSSLSSVTLLFPWKKEQPAVLQASLLEQQPRIYETQNCRSSLTFSTMWTDSVTLKHQGECRKLKQVTDSHMNRITWLCSITHDARAQMYSWKSAVVELFQRSTNEWQHSRSHCPIRTHGGMNSGVRCECLQTSYSLNIFTF